jgi:hypothetical protein
MNPNKVMATNLIRDFFQQGDPSGLVSTQEAGRRMVEIYRLLTDEMPQAPGIEFEYHADETPAVEWSSPTERDPCEIQYVVPGNPDIIRRPT